MPSRVGGVSVPSEFEMLQVQINQLRSDVDTLTHSSGELVQRLTRIEATIELRLDHLTASNGALGEAVRTTNDIMQRMNEQLVRQATTEEIMKTLTGRKHDWGMVVAAALFGFIASLTVGLLMREDRTYDPRKQDYYLAPQNQPQRVPEERP
jgi:hypothetical protein